MSERKAMMRTLEKKQPKAIKYELRRTEAGERETPSSVRMERPPFSRLVRILRRSFR
jgi:hypothetical protein